MEFGGGFVGRVGEGAEGGGETGEDEGGEVLGVLVVGKSGSWGGIHVDEFS